MKIYISNHVNLPNVGFSIRDNVFYRKNAISKNIAEKISYLPKVGSISAFFVEVHM